MQAQGTSAITAQAQSAVDPLSEVAELNLIAPAEILDNLRDEFSENLYDAKNIDIARLDPFFSDKLMKEIMCKHLLFRKGNQKQTDFFGIRKIKERNIEDILRIINNPSNTSEVDSDESFYYQPKPIS